MITHVRTRATVPGGHAGAATLSRAAGSDPIAGASEKSLPDPPSTTLRRQSQPILLVAAGTLHRPRTAADVKDRGTLSRPGITPLDPEGSQKVRTDRGATTSGCRFHARLGAGHSRRVRHLPEYRSWSGSDDPGSVRRGSTATSVDCCGPAGEYNTEVPQPART